MEFASTSIFPDGLLGIKWLLGTISVPPVDEENSVSIISEDRCITIFGYGAGIFDATVWLNGQSECQYPRSLPGKLTKPPIVDIRKLIPSNFSEACTIRSSDK